MYIITYTVIIFFINTSLRSVPAILPLFNVLILSAIFANHLMQNSIHVWYSAIYQKLLIRFVTGDLCSNYDKMVLRVDLDWLQSLMSKLFTSKN